jgi:hypothetical protein
MEYMIIQAKMRKYAGFVREFYGQTRFVKNKCG